MRSGCLAGSSQKETENKKKGSNAGFVSSFPCLSSLIVFKSDGFKLRQAQFQDLSAEMGSEGTEHRVWLVPSRFNLSN